jgi:hypothetical protein
MTANAEARALLDNLMGVERDALLPAGKRSNCMVSKIKSNQIKPFGLVCFVWNAMLSRKSMSQQFLSFPFSLSLSLSFVRRSKNDTIRFNM